MTSGRPSPEHRATAQAPTPIPADDPVPALLRTDAPPIDLSRAPYPPLLRPHASLSVLDITKYFGEQTGGIRTYLLEKSRYVEAQPLLRQVMVVPGPRDSLTQAGGVRCYRLRGPRIPTQESYRFLLATRTTRRIFEHERPDLIEVGSPFIVPWLTRNANRHLGAPLVWFFHTNLPRIVAPNLASARERVIGGLAWRYVRMVNQLFRATFAASESVALELEAAGFERVIRVTLGVDLERFSPGRRVRRKEIRARFGLPEGPLAIFVGRFAAEKQLEVLLEAWPQISARTGAALVLVGSGPQQVRLVARARLAPRVSLLPYLSDRDDLADLLAVADLYVAPGPAETFGLAALEAMASGLPVVSVDRGAVADHVRLSGAGRLYECGSAAALAEAASDLLRSDLGQLGARARAHAERNHAWPVVFERLFQAYRGVLTA